MKKETMKKLKAVGIAASIIGAGALGANVFPKEVEVVNPLNTKMNAELNSLTTEFASVVDTISVLDKEVEQLKAEVDINAEEIESKEALIAELTANATRDSQVIADYRGIEAEVEAEDNRYTFEDAFLNKAIVKTFSDRELSQLQDSEIEFDGDDYDVEETVKIKVTPSTDVKDAEGKTYLSIEALDVEYTYTVDSKLNTSDISEDETLKINLLGKDIEISKWDNNEITLTTGDKYSFKNGEMQSIEGKDVRLVSIGDDVAMFTVNGEMVTISEGEDEVVNGMKIYLDKAVTFIDDSGYAKIIVGDSIETTIEDGDEYADDSEYEYVITSNTIGVKLVEAHTELDDDFNALAVGDSIVLPEDFVKITFADILEQDTESYDFDISKNLLRVRGNFVSGINDYDKIYVGNNTIYDEDMEVIGTTIDLADTDLELEAKNSIVKIGNIKIAEDISDIKVANDSIANEEDDVTNNYGVVINNPEDAVEDQKLRITVPEEQAEVIVTVE